jgi:membrane glycosyltransferase
VIDPFVNNLHIVLLRKDRKVSPRIANRRQKLQDKAIILGPHNLTPSQKIELLYDPACMAALHQAVWELPSRTLAAEWGLT